jgi:hypothetical protein
MLDSRPGPPHPIREHVALQCRVGSLGIHRARCDDASDTQICRDDLLVSRKN